MQKKKYAKKALTSKINLKYFAASYMILSIITKFYFILQIILNTRNTRGILGTDIKEFPIFKLFPPRLNMTFICC